MNVKKPAKLTKACYHIAKDRDFITPKDTAGKNTVRYGEEQDFCDL